MADNTEYDLSALDNAPPAQQFDWSKVDAAPPPQQFDWSRVDNTEPAAPQFDWSQVDDMLDPKTIWAGRPVSRSAVNMVAKERGVSPRTIQRLDTWPGRIEDTLAKSVVGKVALRDSEGLQSVADTIVWNVARAVGRLQLRCWCGI